MKSSSHPFAKLWCFFFFGFLLFSFVEFFFFSFLGFCIFKPHAHQFCVVCCKLVTCVARNRELLTCQELWGQCKVLVWEREGKYLCLSLW